MRQRKVNFLAWISWLNWRILTGKVMITNKEKIYNQVGPLYPGVVTIETILLFLLFPVYFWVYYQLVIATSAHMRLT